MQEDVMIEVRERVAEPEVRVKTVPEVLRHAALVIEERGWFGAERSLADEGNGSVCAWLALDASESDITGFHKADRQFRDFVGCKSIMEWNDTPGRTAAEVTAALRAAADAYETGSVRP